MRRKKTRGVRLVWGLVFNSNKRPFTFFSRPGNLGCFFCLLLLPPLWFCAFADDVRVMGEELPVRCRCGRACARHWDAYVLSIRGGQTADEALTGLGLLLECCRANFICANPTYTRLLDHQAFQNQQRARRLVVWDEDARTTLPLAAQHRRLEQEARAHERWVHQFHGPANPSLRATSYMRPVEALDAEWRRIRVACARGVDGGDDRARLTNDEVCFYVAYPRARPGLVARQARRRSRPERSCFYCALEAVTTSTSKLNLCARSGGGKAMASLTSKTHRLSLNDDDHLHASEAAAAPPPTLLGCDMETSGD